MCILVVEDYFNDYLFEKTLLIIAGLDYCWAENGVKAVELCSNNKDINLVLMDIRLPIMDGFEAANKIKAINQKLPVIAITAFAMSNDREIALKNGCDDYLSKPYKSKDFYKLIYKWLNINRNFNQLSF